MAIHPGDSLAGCRVTRLLGRGGMGEVWAAIDESRGGHEVAIKVLLQRAAMKPDLVKRFEREAKITSAIDSPFVCKLLGVTQAADGSTLLIFEHLDGESLADRLKREQYLPLSEVGPLIEDVLRGLAAAHSASVIHRDLKPGNIFIERTHDPNNPERAKILDFGISKLTAKEKEEPTLTAFDATLGSFAYMAPEQIRGAARADERADIYAIGAVAFRSLTGRLPFEGTSAAVLVSLKLDRSAPSLEEVTGEKWPSGVERFLERALDRNRESRFRGAMEALSAWRAIQPRNITKVTLPPSHPPSRQPPKSRGSSLSFSTNHFPEDMPTEVDDPPTMTGDSFASDRPSPSTFPRASARSSRPAPVAPPRPSQTRASPMPRSSGKGVALPGDVTRRETRGPASSRTPAASAREVPPRPSPPPPRSSDPATREARSKRTRNGGR